MHLYTNLAHAPNQAPSPLCSILHASSPASTLWGNKSASLKACPSTKYCLWLTILLIAVRAVGTTKFVICSHREEAWPMTQQCASLLGLLNDAHQVSFGHLHQTSSSHGLPNAFRFATGKPPHAINMRWLSRDASIMAADRACSPKIRAESG